MFENFCKRFQILLILIIKLNLLNCAIYKIPEYEDSKYWNNLGMEQIKNILMLENQRSLTKNVIIFIGDGMGLSTITASRIRKGQTNNKSGEEGYLSFEKFPNVGLSKTYNIDKQVPDSAATATAMFCGVKTNYRVLGLDITSTKLDNEIGKLTSIMDWAILAKKRTGIVTTTRLTHATPAAAYAHTPNRDWECDTSLPNNTKVKDIARQLIEEFPGNQINVLLGGGRYMFGAPEPNDDNYIKSNVFIGEFEKYCKRNDSKNLVNDWLNINNTNNNNTIRKYVKNTEDLRNIDENNIDYLFGLFTPNHFPFNIVRNKELNGEPSLEEMTEKAIKILNNKNNENGFILIIEGGRIDQAHHQNLAKIALDEVLEFEKAIDVAKKLTNNEDTLIIVTADHSHSMTFNGYPLRGNDILGFANKVNVTPYETLTYTNGPGFYNHRSNETNSEKNGTTWVRVDTLINREEPTYRHFAAFPLKDETHGGEDVTVYATGPGSHLIRGVFEQNHIGYVISYSSCIGPAKYLNPNCLQNNINYANQLNNNKFNYNLIIVIIIIVFNSICI